MGPAHHGTEPAVTASGRLDAEHPGVVSHRSAARLHDLGGGHLASVVRDAVTTNLVDTDALITVLGRYAHKYGTARGDGSSLLDRLLTETGIPESTLALSRRLAAGTNSH